jgi:D-alanyl-D-alanine carboxypeptidase
MVRVCGLTICILFYFATNVVAVIAQGAPVEAGEAYAGEIDQYLRRVMEVKHIPGLQAVITKGGEIAYSGNFGFADLAHRVPVTDTTRFRSGSIGKTATALSVALLERDGLLSFDDALADYFPDAPPHWAEITLWDLIDQTSGLQDPRLGWTADFSEEEYLAAAYAQPLSFAPGEHHVYKNVNYDLLGLITERVSGMDWQTLQQERIFRPLGMSRTHGVTARAVVPNGAEGYQWQEGRLLRAAPEFSQSVWDLASGSLWTTAHDWTRLLLSYERGDLFASSFIEEVLLTSRSLDSGHPVNYSFGNWIGEIGGTGTAEHGGGVPGFRTFAALYSDAKVTVVVTCNLSECGEREIAHTVAGLFDDALRVPELTAAEVAGLERFVGIYYFPEWGEGAFVLEDGKLYHQGPWFRHECRMYSLTGCTPEGEARFEFVENGEGEIEGLIYYDSAYDKGWRIEKIR